MPKQPEGFKGGKTASKLNAWMSYLLWMIPQRGQNIGEVNTGPSRVWFAQLPDAAAAERKPFELVRADDKNGAKVRVIVSDLLGDLPDGFAIDDKPPYILSVNDGDIIYAGVTIDTSGEFPGDVTSRFLDCDPVVPDDDPTGGTFYRAIGGVTVTKGKSSPINYRYGPMEGTPYRVWFSDPKQFAIAWNSL